MIELNTIYNEDCMEGMKRIPDGSVDCIICDLPYGTTACAWDIILPFNTLWEQYNRIIKDNGAICLFGSEPFSSMLRMSNLKMYRYDLIWDKGRGTDFQLANKRPLKSHENISIFYKKLPQYNPQKTKGSPYVIKEGVRKSNSVLLTDRTLEDSEIRNYKEIQNRTNIVGLIRSGVINKGERFPLSVIRYSKDFKSFHPTQKPLALIEYLVLTYSNKGDTILDNCMGSGTTALACIDTGRNFIGFEKEKKYFDIAMQRIAQMKQQPKLDF